MKKIYDIVPPHKADTILKPKENTVKEKKKKGFPFRFILIVLVCIIAYGFFMDGHAQVIIYPKTSNHGGEEMFSVNLKQGSIDLENKIIPGIIFSNIQDISEEYSATGKTDKDKKATGTIRVYNKLNPGKPLTLVKGTRFLDDSGDLIFRAFSGFTVPQAKTIDGKFTNGYVDVQVEANESGEKYNIASGTFSVPGLSGTEYYSGIWAEVISPMTGGTKSEVSIVLTSDLESAEQDFREKVQIKNQEDLKKSIPSNYMIYDQSFSTEFENIEIGAKKGDEVISFTVSGKVKTEIMAFRKEHLEDVLESIILGQTTETIVPESLKYNIIEEKSKEEGIELKISYEAKSYWLPDNDFLLQSILGKEKNYSLSSLQNIPEIERAEINLSPFYKTKNPSNKDNVEIKLNFD